MLNFIVVALLALASLGYAASSKPNVLLIMADDQGWSFSIFVCESRRVLTINGKDMLLDSLSVQPNIRNLIGGNGILYEKHYCTVAWCCPSRVNLFTGRAAHNTNVTALSPPYGGWPKFADQRLNTNYLPVWINESGIRTYYVGKFMNSYTVNNFAMPAHPRGWTESNFLVDPYTYDYFHSRWTNGYTSTITLYDGIHTTNVTQQKALAFLDDAAEKGEQFFMMVTPGKLEALSQ
jgi:arylsulfatase A-like enzyme